VATVPTPQQYSDLEAALCRLDEQSRAAKIQRIAWLSDHEHLPSVLSGRTETMHLLQEARSVFVDGHFAATLLLAVSVINHCLVEELQIRGAIGRDPGFEAVLEKSEQLGVLPSEAFGPLRQLAARRHPFVHFKEPKHEHALGARVRLEKSPPTRLLEADAELAIEHMYNVFRTTLRELPDIAGPECDELQ
jgi:hypothetical protein